MKVKIDITGTRKTDKERESLRQSYLGTARRVGEDVVISYLDSLDGFDATKTNIRVAPDMVRIFRTGPYNTDLTIQPGVSHCSTYSTPMGDMLFTVSGQKISSEIRPDGGVVRMEYDMDFEEGYITNTKMDFRFEALSEERERL